MEIYIDLRVSSELEHEDKQTDNVGGCVCVCAFRAAEEFHLPQQATEHALAMRELIEQKVRHAIHPHTLCHCTMCMAKWMRVYKF